MSYDEAEHGAAYVAGRIALATFGVLLVLLLLAALVRPGMVMHMLHLAMQGTRMMVGL